MSLIWQGIAQAFQLLIHGDREMLNVASLSLRVSLIATAISLVVGITVGTAIGLAKFTGKKFLMSLVNTGMGLPPVVVGLVVMIFLWRSGPLGDLKLIFTPTAMIIAQVIISLPIITGFTMASIQQLDPKLRLQIQALGASRFQMLWLVLKETRLPLLAAVMAGFGGIISEVGASQMVGANITGQTRVLTTAIVMEAGKGDFGLAIALSVILMIIVFLVNLVLTIIQQRGRAR
jgi:tungstate transport system permease protein